MKPFSGSAYFQKCLPPLFVVQRKTPIAVRGKEKEEERERERRYLYQLAPTELGPEEGTTLVV